MTDILVRNLSAASKPRSLKECMECREPAYPGIPRYRAQFVNHYPDAPPSAEIDGYLHMQCATRWFTRLIRTHREVMTKGLKK